MCSSVTDSAHWFHDFSKKNYWIQVKIQHKKICSDFIFEYKSAYETKYWNNILSYFAIHKHTYRHIPTCTHTHSITHTYTHTHCPLLAPDLHCVLFPMTSPAPPGRVRTGWPSQRLTTPPQTNTDTHTCSALSFELYNLTRSLSKFLSHSISLSLLFNISIFLNLFQFLCLCLSMSTEGFFLSIFPSY